MIDQRRKLMSATPQPIENQLMAEAQALTTDLFEDRPDDMTVEEWNEIYLQVQAELHEQLAKELISLSQQDEELNFEAYERFSQ